jgi:HAD superfamily PSPase-like hydrolase
MKKLLFVLDMDGTITQSICWKDLHEYFNTLEEAEKHREMFLAKRITYEEWMKKDIALWNNPRIEEVRKVLLSYELVKGFEKFLERFRGKSIFCILSSGIDIRAKDIAEKLGIHEVYANSLVVREGRVIGGICSVDPSRKGETVRDLQKRYRPALTIAVGDTHFDVSMFRVADIGIAMCNAIDGADFCAKDFHEAVKFLEEKLSALV